MGVASNRIDTIIDFAAAAKYGVKTEGSFEAATADVLAQLAGLLAAGCLEVPIAKVYPLAQVRDAYLTPQRFVFVFTPTHGSWLNLIETQFSKMARTIAGKQELIDRIHQCFEEINADPVVFRWKYKMDEVFIV